MKEIYRRFHAHGSADARNLHCVDSYIQADFGRCFQIMECDGVTLLLEWAPASFQLVPMVASEGAATTVERHL